ncbi:cation transporting P-ATPase, putative [Plasmodium gallinaceum]|uniref:Cation transporting P-ATPase, putative n=1 Tax=Plasmodium gallinaceum TaxID=5849 RepID=A0A1J1GZE0_PLAGA|nr:cation transporting P-ATPase, putative [Plasmodium gallinaceum]CRG97817.1 cation transporting P-ATPase, putative [Plasmodium gallinaceum]
MFRFCKSDSLLINYKELKYICFIYIFLLLSFFIWCLCKKHFQNKINKRHKWRNHESKYKNEKLEFFNYIYESANSDEVIIRQEGYKNSFVGFMLKNISIIFYLITHIIIILLIINEYCIYENNEKLWNDRAFVFFIFFLLSFIITYGILIVRKHMHGFFLKPSLLKDSDYVLIYTKNEDYINFYKNIFKDVFEFFYIFFKNNYYKLRKFLFLHFHLSNNYKNENKSSIFQYKKNGYEEKYKEFNKIKRSKNQENIMREDKIIRNEKKKKIETKSLNKLKVHKVKVRINEKNIRYFFFRSMKYVYNEKKDAFYNISHSINEKVNNLDFNYILKKGGLNNNEIINNINEYGYNNIHLEFYSLFKNLKRELLDGIYMFQLFITYKNFFWKEIITSLIWLVISLLTVMKKIFKNQKNKKEIFENIQANNNTVVTVYRNSIVQQIPSNNLTIGDIIIITSKMTIPCDCLLLTGNVLVDESLLTGESRPMKKICISNLNSFNSCEKINSSESYIFNENQENFIEKQKGINKKKNYEANIINKRDYNKQNEHNKYFSNNYNTNNILYAGTDVISTLNFSDNIYAIVINVSIYTYKGKYMQNVLFPNPLLFKYDSQLPIVFIFTILFSLICFYFQIYYLGFNMTSIFYSIGTLSQILPVWTPVVLNIGLNISTNRLKKEKNICCIAPSRIPICGKIRIFFFDKTGTLTDHKIELSGVHFCNNILNEKKKIHSRHSNHNKSISDDTYDIKFENFSLLNNKNFKSFYKNNLKKNWNLRDFDYNAPHFLSNNIVEYYSSNNINNNVFAKSNIKDKNDSNNNSQHSFYSSIGFNETSNINQEKNKNINNEYMQKSFPYYKSKLFTLTDNDTYDQQEKEKFYDQKSSNCNKNERSNGSRQTSTGDVFQSYDEMEEHKYYEDEIKNINYKEQEKNIYNENLKKINKDNKKNIQKKGLDKYNNPNNYKISYDEEEYNKDNFENKTKDKLKKDQQISINVDSNITRCDNFIKKKQKKDFLKNSNKKGINNTIAKTSNINESNTSMNLITSLLYNSKLMWTNKVTFNNTPSNYHLLIYALAGCSCVYYDSNNIYGNEIDKRLFEATEMRISNYINKHDMNIKKITLKMNDEYKCFDILKTYEFDYYTKISTTLSYGYFDFEDKIYIVFSKGSFDKIYQKCIKNDEIYFFKKKEQEYSKNGFYVIALAFKIIRKSSYENIMELSREELEKEMNFLSLIMFNNHVKNDAPNVIQTLKDSSIRPVILTGDNAYNCLYVGNRIGLFSKVEFYDSCFSLNINSNINYEIKKNNNENEFQSNETKFLSFENLIKSSSSENKLGNSSCITEKYNEQSKKKKKNKNIDKRETDKENVKSKKYVDIKYSSIKSKYNSKNFKYEPEENTPLLSPSKKEDRQEESISNNLNQNDCSIKNSVICKISNDKDIANSSNNNGTNKKNYNCNDIIVDKYNSVNNSKENDKNIKDKESILIKSKNQYDFMNNKASHYINEEKYEENIIVYGYVLNDELVFVNIQNDKKINKNIVLYHDIYKEIILTGEAYLLIKQSIFHIKNTDEEFNNEGLEEYKNFLLRVRIFSRLTPNNKIEVIKDFISFGYISGMCGDGSNDCGALKISHAGLALSNSDTSVVSPFSSRNENLKSVIDILREGRACLVTSINCYKYMLLYGFMISIIKIVLFMHAHAVMSEYGYLFFDNVILLLLAKSMTLSKPALKLKTQTPTSSIIGAQTILSLLCTLFVNFFFLYIIIFQFFYIYNLPTSYHMNSSAPKSSWWLMSDNYESFLTCIWFCFQIVNSAFILTFGGKYRKNIFTNYTFMTYYFLINSFLLYLTLGGPNKLTCLFRMNCNNEISKTTKFKILDLFSYSASGLNFYGPNGNNILSRNHKIRFLFLNFLNIAFNIFISKYILCEKLYNMVRKFFNYKNRKIPV